MDAEIYSAILYAVIAFLVLWIVCLEACHFATKDEEAGDDTPTAADAGVAVADVIRRHRPGSPPRPASMATTRATAGDDGVSQRRWAQAKCAVLVVIFVLVALFLTGCEGEGGAYCSGEGGAGDGHEDCDGGDGCGGKGACGLYCGRTTDNNANNDRAIRIRIHAEDTGGCPGSECRSQHPRLHQRHR